MPFWEAQPALTAVQWLSRAVILYVYLLTLTKIMGQREIGRLTLFDFIIGITIGSIVAGALSSSYIGLKGVFTTVAALAGFQIILSIASLKFSRFRRVVEEEPIILVQNGKLLVEAMRKTRINLDELMSLLRQKSYFNLSQVEFAILEPNGKISVIAKSQNRPVTPSDLNIATNYEGYPVMVIEDGNIIQDNLKRNNLTEQWLRDELRRNNIPSHREVFAAMLDTQGRLYFSLKNNASERTAS
ncbi:MAG: YetF domain-containing protein [Bacillota bacterium]